MRDEELKRGNRDLNGKQRKQLTSMKKDAIICMRRYAHDFQLEGEQHKDTPER